ncbi:aminoglycoside 6-adenylyltransferase [Lysinibacter sp. HNR]|uniref:aminoglycoside 6-adenylyltransferase n=1 Tax=Lysinibacter sp. HNR TaxID=3031408 RepID=UPI0024359DBE|nr:aminoglycoside 6-adenylyltransferase [Lysinibacter sp. HNR]WGD38405.1 aminoglycoside 6-adenylyltransferase [Lysinibacter sp. HNR]
MDYTQVINTLVHWASTRDDIRALVLTGSAASHTAHPLSDRDIEVFSTDVPALLTDETWWRALGEVLVIERLTDGENNPTRLVYYRGGKIDFTLLPPEQLRARPRSQAFRVLLDKDNIASSLSLHKQTALPPSAQDFNESINWAWAAALMQARAIVRHEPWSAKIRDADLKKELLRMIEWDHHARYGSGFNTHHRGARMRQWMDAEVQQALEQCWAGFSAEDSIRALRATTTLYRSLAGRTATNLALPDFNHGQLETELHRILGVQASQ